MTTPLTPIEAALSRPESKLARAIGKVRLGGTRSGHFFDEDGWRFLLEAVSEARAALRERRERVDPDPEEAGLDVANRLEMLVLGVTAMAITDEARRRGWQAIETPLRKAWLASRRLPLSEHTRTLPAPGERVDPDLRGEDAASDAYAEGYERAYREVEERLAGLANHPGPDAAFVRRSDIEAILNPSLAATPDHTVVEAIRREAGAIVEGIRGDVGVDIGELAEATRRFRERFDR